ncbi:MAG: hypothetical protein NTX05_03595 [Fusobacteria bacterium]|nr:hypothetical protein [Fusobacteriota bacterium]
MGKFMNFLLIVTFLILLGLIGINYLADKELTKYHVKPSSIKGTQDEINGIIDSASRGVKQLSGAISNQKISKKTSEKESQKTRSTAKNSKTTSSTNSTKLPIVNPNINQTYFNSSKN